MYSNCCHSNRQTNCCTNTNECLELDNCCNIIRRNRSCCDCQQQQPPPQRIVPDFNVPRAKNTPSKSNGKKRKSLTETSRRSSLPRNEQALDRNIEPSGPCPPCPCPCPPCPCSCSPCCGASNGKRGSVGNGNGNANGNGNGSGNGNGNGSNTKNLKNKQNYQQYQDMFVGNKKQRMEVINEEQEERCGCLDSDECYFDSEHSKKIQESCADFLSIVHDTVLETVQKSVETIMRDYFQHTMEKVECLCTQQMRNECLLSKMYLDIMDKISQQNDKSLRQFKCLCQLIAENRNNEGNAKTAGPCRENKPCCDETCPCGPEQDCKDCNCGAGNCIGCNANGNNNGGRRRSSNTNNNNNYGGNGNGNGNGGSGSRRNSDSNNNQRGSNNNNSDTELYRKPDNAARNGQRQKDGSNTSLSEEFREIRHLSNEYGGRKSADIKRYSVKSGPSVPDLNTVRSRNSISKSN